jgi:hypothetical protein
MFEVKGGRGGGARCILVRDVSVTYIECSKSHTITEAGDICKVVSVACREILSLFFLFCPAVAHCSRNHHYFL